MDAVAHGVPMRLTANCESVIACVHAHPPRKGDGNGGDGNGGGDGKQPPLAALLDVNSGEGAGSSCPFIRSISLLE